MKLVKDRGLINGGVSISESGVLVGVWLGVGVGLLVQVKSILDDFVFALRFKDMCACVFFTNLINS